MKLSGFLRNIKNKKLLQFLCILLIFSQFFTFDLFSYSNFFENNLEKKIRKRKFRTTVMGGNFLNIGSALYFKEAKGFRTAISFDFFAQKEKKFILTLDFGAGYIYYADNNSIKKKSIFFPTLIHLLYGENNYLDLGYGAMYLVSHNFITPLFYLGYRYQPFVGGLSFKLGCEVFLERTYKAEVDVQKVGIFGLKFGFGYSF